MLEGDFKFLLVEDETVHAKLTIRELEKIYNSISIRHIENGEECIDSLKKDSNYDVVILDYSLPKLNGLEVMKQIKSMGLMMPVILVTGHGDEKVAVEAMKLGACDYVIKTEDYFSRIPYVASDCIEMSRLRREKTLLESKLKESEERFRNLFMASSDGILTMDNQNRIVSSNPATQAILGYTRENLESRFFNEIIKNPEKMDKIDGLLRDKGEVANYELILMDVKCESKTTLASFFYIRNDQNQIIGLGCVFKDITERKRNEERINALLEETQRKSQELARLNKVLEDYITGKRSPV
ncbi:response regulator [bacterium]|nr:response regulator [bacterium]